MRLTQTRARYSFYRWFRGRPERLTLPEVGTVQLREVRRIVDGLRGDLAKGVDVFARARSAKQPAKPITLQDAFEAHIKRPDLRPGTRRDYTSAWRNVPSHLKAKPIAAIDETDLKRLHDAIGERGHPRLANKVIVLISGLLRGNGRQADNPAVNIKRFRETPRQRVLTLGELRRLRSALESEPSPWREYFLLLLLTGARRSSLARMRWEDLDLDTATWRLPAGWSKNRRVLTVALPSEALTVLRRLASERSAAPWVFPAQSQAGHLVEPKRAWRRACARAGIAGAVIHDLRRTTATLVASDGANAAALAVVLGHLTPQSAKSYIHLSSETGRQYLERAAQKSRAA